MVAMMMQEFLVHWLRSPSVKLWLIETCRDRLEDDGISCWLLVAVEKFFDIAIVSREPAWYLRPVGANRSIARRVFAGH